MLSFSFGRTCSAVLAELCEEIFQGVPVLHGKSNYTNWGRHCYARLNKYGLMEFIKGDLSPPSERPHEKESEPFFEDRVKLLTATSKQAFAFRLILLSCQLDIQIKYPELETAKLLWETLRSEYSPLSEPQDGPASSCAFRAWKHFVDLKYSGEPIEQFCNEYRDAVWLCEEAELKLEPKVQSLQFVALLESSFPEWCQAKQSHMPTTENPDQIPELESLVEDIVREEDLSRTFPNFRPEPQDEPASSSVNFGAWKYFIDLKYSGESVEEFCDVYRDAVWLCEVADLKLEPKVQSLQFVASLESRFPEWGQAKQSLMPTPGSLTRFQSLNLSLQIL
ncbi:unnamed protein product [Calypogeia fissa]